MARKVSVIIETNGNAAFDEDPELEIADILRKAAAKLESHELPLGTTRLLDVNGNRCGEVTIEED